LKKVKEGDDGIAAFNNNHRFRISKSDLLDLILEHGSCDGLWFQTKPAEVLRDEDLKYDPLAS